MAIRLTFLIAWHLAGSVKPIMFSGLQILRNGNCEFLAIWAASAVFPVPGAPENWVKDNKLLFYLFNFYSAFLIKAI